jgi:hypothetical protein
MVKRPSLASSVKPAEANPKQETVKVTFELDEPMYTRLRVFAARQRLSGRKVLVDALQDYLAKHDPPAASRPKTVVSSGRRTGSGEAS